MQTMWLPMALGVRTVLIVAVGVFLASFVDGIAGGGGLISVPAYLLAGLPPHLALGTNKLSAGIGTAVSVGRFIRSGYVDWPLAIPSAILAVAGAHLGTRLQLAVDERYLKWLLLAVLPLAALVVLRQHTFPEEPGEISRRRQFAVVLSASLAVGVYDGFYGPGTGTFLLVIFCRLGKMDVRTAGGNVKVVNLSSNVGALVASLMGGKVFLALGLIGAVCSIAGHYLGSGLAIKNGSRIVKPVVLTVLALLAVKMFCEFLGQ